MDWNLVRSAICDGRAFTRTEQGCRLRADTLMPSGAPIFVNIRSRNDALLVHDGGAAFDELVRHGMELQSSQGVRRMLKKTNFTVTPDGLICRERVSLEHVAISISLVADASLRAAAYMLARATRATAVRLDSRLKDMLRLRYPGGKPDYAFEGKHRQHTFDFGVAVEDQIILVQAVTPDSASISSAIVKGLDAREALGAKVHPIFVYDPRDEWKSGSLGMLSLGGQGMSIERASRGQLLEAA